MANLYYGVVGDYTSGTRARGSEITTEFDSIEDGFDKVELVVDENGALGKDLTGGAAYQLTDMVDGVNAQDYATMANVAAELAGGGTPGSIPVTSLDVGTATASQFVTINSGGTAVVGIDPPLPKGYINGLELNNFDEADNQHDMRVEAGSCRNSADTANYTLATAITKQMDAVFAEGDDAGGYYTAGGMGASETIWMYLIVKDSDGTTLDMYGDTSSSAANIPTGWSLVRCLGVHETNTGSNWGIPGDTNVFVRRQIGNHIVFAFPGSGSESYREVSDSSISVTVVSLVLAAVPTGIKGRVALQTRIENGAAASAMWISYVNNASGGTSSVSGHLGTAVPGFGLVGQFQVHAQVIFDTDATVYYDSSGTVTNSTLYINTLGYEDFREVNY